MNKKVLLYGGITLGVAVLGFVIYKVVQNKKEEKSATSANAPSEIMTKTTTSPIMVTQVTPELQARIDAFKNLGSTLV